MKTTTLIRIARHIEKVLGQTVSCTEAEMVARLKDVAGHCRTKREAASLIATEIYRYGMFGERTLDQEILSVR